MPKNVIILSKGDHKQSYGSLTEICSEYPNFSYNRSILTISGLSDPL